MIRAIVFLTAGAALACAADFSTYRGFRFGSSPSAATKQAGENASDARMVHKRPALIEEMDFRPNARYRSEGDNSDPVGDAVLRFYNGELFQIVSTYKYQRVEGMSEADMVEAISQTYGAATKPGGVIPFHSNYGETAAVLARWEDKEYAYSLVRTGDRMSYALVLTSKRLEALARVAIVEAVRLDALEAPQKAKDLQRKTDDDSRANLDKARSANRPNFRP